jgi:hypothetical protein
VLVAAAVRIAKVNTTLRPVMAAPRFDKIKKMSTSTKDLLTHARTIAVVGASKDPTKPGATIPMAMQTHGFRIIPVNPTADLLFGERAYKTLADIPEPVDIVNVFRPASEAPGIAEQAVAIKAKALWLQTGIASDEARTIAEAGGLAYVEDHCIAVERAKHAIDRPRR